MARHTRSSLVEDLQKVRELVDRLLEATKRGAFDPCDCFMAEERFLTPRGVRSFAETVGTDQDVLTRYGWRPAEIQSFGVQDVQLVSFAASLDGDRVVKSTWRRNVAVTPSHPWILQGDILTYKLAIGDTIPGVHVQAPRVGEEYEAGLRHGLVFGDGYMESYLKRGEFRHIVELQGARTAQYAGIFERFKRYPSRVKSHPETYYGTGIVYDERNLKERPDDDVSASYLAGFVDGWLAADASRRGDAWKLHSVNLPALAWLADRAPLAGYFATGRGLGKNLTTNLGKRSGPMGWLGLRSQETSWRVVDIKPLGQAETFCAVVPDGEEFVLEGGLLTHNCGHSSVQHALIWEGPATGYRPCLIAGCDCLHFDDAGQQYTEFMRKLRLAEEDAREYERRAA